MRTVWWEPGASSYFGALRYQPAGDWTTFNAKFGPTSTIAVGNGGTGATTFTPNAVVLGNEVEAHGQLALRFAAERPNMGHEVLDQLLGLLARLFVEAPAFYFGLLIGHVVVLLEVPRMCTKSVGGAQEKNACAAHLPGVYIQAMTIKTNRKPT